MSFATLFVGPGTILLDFESPEHRGEMTFVWVLVGLGVLYLGFAIVRLAMAPRDRRRLRRLRDLAIGVVLVGSPLVAMTGAAPWMTVAAAWVLPALAVLFDRRLLMPRAPTGRADDARLLRTRFLQVVPGPDPETPDAEVIRGRFRGRRLSELSPGQLDTLLQEVSSDPDTVSILTGILLRFREARHGADSRGDSQTGHGRRGSDGARGANRRSGAMDVAEAYRVLGVSPGVSKAEILAAHRRLMKRVHPDKGGSDYFASKLNEARDLLLNREA